MDESKLMVAYVSGGFALMVGLISALVTLSKHRLEKRQLRHEEVRWLLELHGDLERKLLDARLERYPEVFKELQQLSHFPPVQRTPNDWLKLAETINNWGYGKAGVVMLPDTRAAVFKLREAVRQLADGTPTPEQIEQMMKAPRTDVAELMQRDLNLTGSVWRDNLPSLMSRVAKIVDQTQPTKSWWAKLLGR